jgi:hypothetical protein
MKHINCSTYITSQTPTRDGKFIPPQPPNNYCKRKCLSTIQLDSQNTASNRNILRQIIVVAIPQSPNPPWTRSCCNPLPQRPWILRPTNRSRARTYGRFGEDEATGDGGAAPRGPSGGGIIHWPTGDGDAAPPRSAVGHGLPQPRHRSGRGESWWDHSLETTPVLWEKR